MSSSVPIVMGPVTVGIHSGLKSNRLAYRLADEGDPAVVEAILAERDVEDPKVRNATWKVLSHLAARRPEWFQERLAFFLDHLNDERNVVKWAAMDVAGYLVGLDGGNLINDDVVAVMVDALSAETMVTAAHGIDNLVRIGLAQPTRHSECLAELFRVESIPRAADCREVLLGKVADGLGKLLPHLSEVNRAAAMTFLNRLALSDGRDGHKALKIIRRQSREKGS